MSGPALDPNVVTAGGVFVSFVAAITSFIVGQRHGKAEFITAVNKAAEVVITKLQQECLRFEDARIRCEESHIKCQADLAQVRAEVAALMRGRVASFGEQAPSDV